MKIRVLGSCAGGGLPQWNCGGEFSTRARSGDPDVPPQTQPSIAVSADGERWSMRQIPDVNGAVVAMDPHTGRVLAMQGGFSYDASVFNRATQAKRQPGSSFKPFVYAAALEHGYHPNTVVLDAPVTLDVAASGYSSAMGGAGDGRRH